MAATRSGARTASLLDLTSYADAQRHFSSARLWELFDGDRDRLNIGHECLDRHPADRVAIRLAHADGRDETLTFGELASGSSRVAHFLAASGVVTGDRVALMLEPSFAFYAGLFGAAKLGAIAVPLFTLFGPDGLRLRIKDCAPRLLLTAPETAGVAAAGSRGPESAAGSAPEVLVVDDAFIAALAKYPPQFRAQTRADDLAVFQYTSGTTRELPEAVEHTHRALVVLMSAALYGTGLRPGDRFFCPSSPAWGHGLWHGTLAPLALGISTGTWVGRLDAQRLLAVLETQAVTNLSAAATHYRMMRNCGAASRYRYGIAKLSFTGEPMDSATRAFVETTFGVRACSLYGTTETGVILADYPGAEDYAGRPGALGKPLPGVRVEVQGPDGTPCPPNVRGEIRVWRHGAWIPTRDRGWVDADGYFFHGGRADDVIISAGWTMSAVEIEDVLLKHPDVREAAAIGVADALRGQVVKALIVSERPGDAEFEQELQAFVRSRLSQHEYPRIVAFVPELPRTAAGKVNRQALREREQAAG